MAIAPIWNPGWLSGNSQRSYPISEAATNYFLPNDFIVDAVISYNFSDGDSSKFHIKTVAIFATGATVIIGYDGEAAGTASIVFSGYQTFTPATITGLGNFTDITGTIIFGEIDNARENYSGAWEFSLGEARLEAHVVRPSLKAVTSIRTVENGVQSARLFGDVELTSGNFVQITTEETLGGADITLSVTSSFIEELNPVLSISNITPDENGNIDLIGSDCIDISPATNALEISNTCSEPCCGCEELDVIVQDLRMLNTQVNTLNNLNSRLEAAMQQMEMSIIASKTGELPSGS